LNRALIKDYLVFCCKRGPVRVDLLSTILVWAGIAAFLMITGIRRPQVTTLIVCEALGISLFLARRILFFLFKPEAILSLISTVIAALAVGLSVGYYFAGLVVLHVHSAVLKPNFFHLTAFFVIYVSAVTFVFYSKYRLAASMEAIQQERIKRISIEKEALEGSLRLLQAQVEPHFLFNTLSNVLSLIDTDPTKGKSMLADLIHYLRTSLSRTLPAVTTLGQETDIVTAYLNIQKIRMDERLRFAIRLPEGLRQFPLPPMLLLPLVENAIKHGLEPRTEGGEISINASTHDDVVRIEVADTGKGFSSCNEAGVGIGNVRERIRLLYGAKGRLILEENGPHGIKAIIEVPGHGL
jgi:sensor histidine kinase YesM